MSTAIAEQIKTQFRGIQDVKFASAALQTTLTSRNHAPDIVVETWMNSRLYVYLVEEPPKTRHIRAVLKQNTSASIGSLFLIDAALLPADGYRGRLPDWQDDLRVMNRGAIYAFSDAEKDLRLIQVNMDETARRGHFIVWHTIDFPFDTVSVRRRDFQTNIRGSWHIGDIASAKFKRRISEERARQRFHYRTKQTQALADGPPEQISLAYLALEIEVGAGQEAVKEAFRSLARKYHPDVSEHDKDEAEKRFKEVTSAYERIKSHRRWS
ncbi:MAG: J domain-containing protein [Chloroflexi bacterium]|nr:J domain-containing protein [Chloroflexota bacterium]